MPTRRKSETKPAPARPAPRRPARPAAAADPGLSEDAEEPVAGADEEVDPEAIVAAVVEEDEELIEDDLDEDDDDEDDDDDEEAAVVVVAPVAPVRPAPRPSPGRPPSAKEEPEPPFYVGERVVLTRNTRPRTGTPIADHPVGAQGRVETVLSQTAIIRFDRAADTKEVVAFTCLESIDDDAKARRAEREKELAREAKEREKERERAEREKARGAKA